MDNRLEEKNQFDGNLVYGLKNFNKKTGRDVHLERINREANYIDRTTGRLKDEITYSRPCPVCSSLEARTIFVKDGFPHVKCSLCSMVYVNPVLRDEHSDTFYFNEESWNKILLNSTQVELDRKKFEYGLKCIEKFMPGKGTLLDVGCGPGIFLEEACKRGWSVQGLEFNKFCITRLRENNFKIIDLPIEEIPLQDNSIQCITLWDVLEHIHKPYDMLSKIFSLLEPDGILLVSVANVNALVNRILHQDASAFAGHAHVNFFSPETLNTFVNKIGFEILNFETILTELGTINNYLNYDDPYFGEAKPVFGFLTPEFIHENLLGKIILLVVRARK